MKITASIQKGKSKDLDKLAKRFKDLNKEFVEIGYFDGEMHSEAGMSYASLMTVLEFGTPTIPARFPFSQIAHTRSPAKDKSVKRAIKKHLINLMTKPDATELLNHIGKYYQKELRGIFGDTSRLESNSKTTIALKGRDEPLVDTEELKVNLGYKTSKSTKVTK